VGDPPNGTSEDRIMKKPSLVIWKRHFRSVRRVAGRNRRVARATQTIFAIALGAPSAPLSTPFYFSCNCGDAEGHPVAGAIIARYEYAEGYGFRPGADWELKQKVTTPPDGSFDLSLPRTTALFLVTKAGLAPVWHQFWNTRQDLTNQQLVATSPT